jgi:hypothetical protein
MGALSPKKRAEQLAMIAEGMAFAVRWRLANQIYNAMHPVVSCLRCEGVGLTWWCGKPGEGGRRGPCPCCQREAARNFVQQLGRALFA